MTYHFYDVPLIESNCPKQGQCAETDLASCTAEDNSMVSAAQGQTATRFVMTPYVIRSYAYSGDHTHLLTPIHRKIQLIHSLAHSLAHLHTNSPTGIICLPPPTHFHHHPHQSLNRQGRWGTTDDFATRFLHIPCSPLPSGTCRTPGLSIP